MAFMQKITNAKIKAIALILVAITIAILSGCQSTTDSKGNNQVPTSSATQQVKNEAVETPVATETVNPTTEPTPTPTPKTYLTDESLPYQRYYIEVDTVASLVYVYDVDDSANDTKDFTTPTTLTASNVASKKGDLMQVFICSCGKTGSETPLGTWIVLDNQTDDAAIKNTCGFDSKYDQEWLSGGTAQYIVRLWKVDVQEQSEEWMASSYLFHSVPYYSRNKTSLKAAEWNKIGGPASEGCVRLYARDAHWIYTHVAPYSYVNTIEGTPNAELWNARKLPDILESATTDPTDLWI